MERGEERRRTRKSVGLLADRTQIGQVPDTFFEIELKSKLKRAHLEENFRCWLVECVAKRSVGKWLISVCSDV